MKREWNELLRPIKVSITEGTQIKEAYHNLRVNDTDIGFITRRKEIIGYYTSNTLLEQMINSPSEKMKAVQQEDFLFVKEHNLVRNIYNCKIVIILDNEDNPVGFVEMKDVEDKLAMIHLKDLNKGLNSASIGLVIMDKFFRVKFMNETAEQIFGMAKELFIRRDYRKIIRSQDKLESVINGNRLINVENNFNFKQIIGQYAPVYRGNEVIGIIHNFYEKEQFNHVVNQIDFVKEMSTDLEMFYKHSNEQIIITNNQGKIIKVAGAYFNSFFGSLLKEDLPGVTTENLTKKGIFTPDIVTACINKKEKIIMKQFGKAGVILSTATPVIENGKLKKVIVLSKNITQEKAVLNPVIESSEKIEKPIIYQSIEMTELMEVINTVSPLNSTVLIAGESGVGKEIIARAVHQKSERRDEAFIAVNCGAIPENLIESELFGHEKGAFTGAHTTRLGLFEQANQGTIFLDEVGELPYLMQVKLLRVLQEREIMRIGGDEAIQIDFRVIAATNKNLLKEVHQNKFREDLYYRLYIVPLKIPALRNRPDDIVPLAVHFLEYFNSKFKRSKKEITYRALSILEAYEWPGNIRELRNVIERLVITSHKKEIDTEDVFHVLWSDQSKENHSININQLMPLKEAVEETERQLIELALKKFKTAKAASKYLEVSMSTISRRKKFFEMDGESE